MLPIPDAPDVMTYHAYALSVLRKVGCRASVIHASDARKLMRQVLVHVGVLDEAKDGGGQSRAAIRAALALVSRVKNCPNPKKALSPAQQATVDSFNAGLSARGLISFDDMVRTGLLYPCIPGADRVSPRPPALCPRCAPPPHVPLTAPLSYLPALTTSRLA